MVAAISCSRWWFGCVLQGRVVFFKAGLAGEPQAAPDPRAGGANARRPERATASLPGEIAFLASHGIGSGLLLKAQAQARREGVHPADLMIAEGWIEAGLYYACLARHCGAAFLDDATLSGSARHPQTILAGAAQIQPVRGARWLLAPQGAMIARTIALARARRGGFAIATPQTLSRLARARCAREMAAAAAHELPGRDPDLSARRAPGPMAMPLLAAALALAIVSPLLPLGLVLLSAVFLLACAVRLLAAFAEPAPRRPPAPLPDHALPRYSIVVPLYDEARVVPRLAAALRRLDYPRSKLDVLLVIEERDRATRAALEAQKLPAHMQVLVAPAGMPRTKPRALNMALPLARGSLMVVYDAEDQPDPQQLRLAAARFALAGPRVACLQASLAIENAQDSWLTRLFALEYAALFDVFNPGLAALGLPLALGGTSNHFRVSSLRACGGWDAWNVTEDADLGLRLARCGFQVETIASTTLEEAPVALRAWLGQRRRWQKGWVQTAAVLLRDPARLLRELGFWRCVATVGLAGGMVLGPLLGPFFTAWMAWQSLAGPLLAPQTMFEIVASTLACYVFLAGIAAAVLPAVLGARRRGIAPLLPWLALLPLYYCLMCVAAWQGLAELFWRPFHWQKTAHGMARGRGRVLDDADANGR